MTQMTCHLSQMTCHLSQMTVSFESNDSRLSQLSKRECLKESLRESACLSETCVSPREESARVSLREKRVRACLSETRVSPREESACLFSRRDTHALSSLGEKRVSERHALEENSCLREHSKRVRVSFLGETRTHSLLSERHTRTLFSRRDTHALSSLGETRVRVAPRLSERVLAWMQSLQSLCHTTRLCYGAATVSRADKIIGLFCKRAL